LFHSLGHSTDGAVFRLSVHSHGAEHHYLLTRLRLFRSNRHSTDEAVFRASVNMPAEQEYLFVYQRLFRSIGHSTDKAVFRLSVNMPVGPLGWGSSLAAHRPSTSCQERGHAAHRGQH
jgi:hypothetical protein